MIQWTMPRKFNSSQIDCKENCVVSMGWVDGGFRSCSLCARMLSPSALVPISTTEKIMAGRLLSIKEIRQRINCATSTVYRWMEQDHFPRPLRIGGMARWEEQDIDGFLERAKLRRTKSGVKPRGVRQPGRPPMDTINAHRPKPKPKR